MNNKQAVVVDRDACMECGACMNNCSFEALRVNKGVGCAAAIINSMVYGGEPTCDCSGDQRTQIAAEKRPSQLVRGEFCHPIREFGALTAMLCDDSETARKKCLVCVI